MSLIAAFPLYLLFENTLKIFCDRLLFIVALDGFCTCVVFMPHLDSNLFRGFRSENDCILRFNVTF